MRRIVDCLYDRKMTRKKNRAFLKGIKNQLLGVWMALFLGWDI
jgi:hypothetical protein